MHRLYNLRQFVSRDRVVGDKRRDDVCSHAQRIPAPWGLAIVFVTRRQDNFLANTRPSTSPISPEPHFWQVLLSAYWADLDDNQSYKSSVEQAPGF
jgi:hypothetical protein